MENLVTSLRPRDNLVDFVYRECISNCGERSDEASIQLRHPRTIIQLVLSAGKCTHPRDGQIHFPQCQGESQRHESPHLPG